MSVPLDRLYHFIESIAKKIDNDVIIYRFWPNGSKKIEDLNALNNDLTWHERALGLPIMCHDQEPLAYSLTKFDWDNKLPKILKSLSLYDATQSNLHVVSNKYQKICLVHSEKRSKDVIDYQNNFCIPIYYWSHAIIARDWFRYAKHIQQQQQSVTKTFLIYNRAWSGTREYRLRFTEFLINLNLQNSCHTTVNSIEPELGIHYDQYQFKNPVWRPQTVLEDYFPATSAHSSCSADFDIKDYESTDIEIVLETLFDDNRLHLTEKSLRPIACGQPFILAGTYGSLEYLRSYGFKTFGHVWDERYDLIKDPMERLIAIVDLMRQIANWTTRDRERNLAEAQTITDYNKQHFFSQEFFDSVVNELEDNLESGIAKINLNSDFQKFINTWEHRLTFKEIKEFLENPVLGQHPRIPTIDQVTQVLDILKQRH